MDFKGVGEKWSTTTSYKIYTCYYLKYIINA